MLRREAAALLKAAGWTIKGGRLVNGAGKQFELEFLIASPTFERIIAPYVRNLQRLGIATSIRLVDPTQYQERVKSFDFDFAVRRYVMSATPGVELRNYFSSKAANTKKLQVNCSDGSAKGDNQVVIDSTAAGKCRVTAILDDRSRLTAVIDVSGGGTFNCFENGESVCSQ